MFNKVKEFFYTLIKSRIIYFLVGFAVLFFILLYRCFDLQIVHGEEYLNSFQLRIKKERSLDAPRGNIYDCNGELLAYNQLAYTVKIEDVFESGCGKNAKCGIFGPSDAYFTCKRSASLDYILIHFM